MTGLYIPDFCRMFDMEEVWVIMDTENENNQYNVLESSNAEHEVDQFQLLEERVNGLIEKIMALKVEKEALEEMVCLEEAKVSELKTEVEKLRSVRSDAKQKIMSLLEKMEHAAS